MDDMSGRTVKYVLENKLDGFTVGCSGVQSISYHSALGEGDRHYCDIYFNNGEVERLFVFDSIGFEA